MPYLLVADQRSRHRRFPVKAWKFRVAIAARFFGRRQKVSGSKDAWASRQLLPISLGAGASALLGDYSFRPWIGAVFDREPVLLGRAPRGHPGANQ